MNTFKSTNSKDNAKELLSIAQKGIGYLVSGYKPFEIINGDLEVLLFNTNIVLNSKCLLNSNRRLDIEDYYFSAIFFILKEKMPNSSDEEKRLFINKRLKFYAEEFNRIKNDKNYTALPTYSYFYINPLHDNSVESIYSIELINPIDLLSFTMALYGMIRWVHEEVN